jgi:hypothetical protein
MKLPFTRGLTIHHVLGTIALAIAFGLSTPDAHALPTTVTIFGDLESEAGCPGDFDPACPQTEMVLGSDGIWRLGLDLPTGTYTYYASIDEQVSVLYGQNATLGGPAIQLSLAAPTHVNFYYDDTTHWITDNVNSTIAGVVGDFQSELGCSGDFVPACLRSWLQDPDGDGVYRFLTSALPASTYSALVVHDETFPATTPQVPFTVPTGASVCFTYLPTTHAFDISINQCANVSAVPEPAAFWLACLGLLAVGTVQRLKRPKVL